MSGDMPEPVSVLALALPVPVAFGLAVLASLRDDIFCARDPPHEQTADTIGPRRLQLPPPPGAGRHEFDQGIKRFVVHSVSRELPLFAVNP